MFCKCWKFAPLLSDVLPGTVAAVHLLLPGRWLLGIAVPEQTKKKLKLFTVPEKFRYLTSLLLLSTAVLIQSMNLSAFWMQFMQWCHYVFRLPFYFLGGGDWKVIVCVRRWYFVVVAVCACLPYLTLQKISWLLELKYPCRGGSNLCKWYKTLTFLLVSILLKMQSYFGGEKNVTVQIFVTTGSIRSKRPHPIKWSKWNYPEFTPV